MNYLAWPVTEIISSVNQVGPHLDFENQETMSLSLRFFPRKEKPPKP
jgi:hypothetical protein